MQKYLYFCIVTGVIGIVYNYNIINLGYPEVLLPDQKDKIHYLKSGSDYHR